MLPMAHFVTINVKNDNLFNNIIQPVVIHVLIVIIQCVNPKCPTFFTKKTLEKWDTLGTFTQKVPFLDCNKTKKERSGTFWGDTLWGHALYTTCI